MWGLDDVWVCRRTRCWISRWIGTALCVVQITARPSVLCRRPSCECALPCDARKLCRLPCGMRCSLLAWSLCVSGGRRRSALQHVCAPQVVHGTEPISLDEATLALKTAKVGKLPIVDEASTPTSRYLLHVASILCLESHGRRLPLARVELLVP